MDEYLLSPVEIIHGIDKMESGGWTEIEIIKAIARRAEDTARKALSREGITPQLEIYGYVDDPELTLSENIAEQRKFERSEWANEAMHYKDSSDVEISAAAYTIIEAGQLDYFLDTGQTEKAIISMAYLLACGLLHSDQNNEQTIFSLRNRHKRHGAVGGNNKLGYEKPIKKYVRKACESLKLGGLDVNRAARKIMKQFEEDGGNFIYEEIYQDNETCPIVVIEYIKEKQLLLYHAISKPNDQDNLTFERLKNIIREIRSPKKNKPE